MKRRAELAQALINSPKVMVLDEPFRGLDVMTRELMQEYYIKLFEETRLTTVFITSELEEAIFLADRILIMDKTHNKITHARGGGGPRPGAGGGRAGGRGRGGGRGAREGRDG